MDLKEMLGIAGRCVQQNRWADAEQVCTSILAIDASAVDALFLLGMVHCMTNRQAVGFKMMSHACEQAEDRSDLHLAHGRILAGLGERGQAEAAYLDVLKRDPLSLDALSELRSIYRRARRAPEAIAIAERMVALAPEDGARLRDLSDLYKMGNRIADATRAFQRALVLSPDVRGTFHGETAKAKSRRERDGFFTRFCQGKGLDIGWGGDLLAPNCVGWDIEDGDSETLEGLADASFDFAYSSHNIEHVDSPVVALSNWWRVVRPGGYLIIFAPHRDLYEKRKTLPSRWNTDHRRFFLPYADDPPDTIGLVPLITGLLTDGEIVYVKECDEGHTITDPNTHSDGEYSIEVVVQKKALKIGDDQCLLESESVPKI